jgi:hypothetical protein
MLHYKPLQKLMAQSNNYLFMSQLCESEMLAKISGAFSVVQSDVGLYTALSLMAGLVTVPGFGYKNWVT